MSYQQAYSKGVSTGSSAKGFNYGGTPEASMSAKGFNYSASAAYAKGGMYSMGKGKGNVGGFANVNGNSPNRSLSPNPAQVSNLSAYLNAKEFVPDSVKISKLDPEKRYEGSIKSYNVASGFGFIACTDIHTVFDCDVFFNHQIEGVEKIENNMVVSFNVVLSEQNRPQARNLKLTDAPKNAMLRNPPKPDAWYVGQVRSMNPVLGYGFLNCAELRDHFDRDVFLHKQFFHKLHVGDTVKFQVQCNAKGHPQAQSVEKNNGGRGEAEEEESFLKLPNGEEGEKFFGKLRNPNQHDAFAFLESEQAFEVCGVADVFLHRNFCPKGMNLGEEREDSCFEFDIVLINDRPQARNVGRAVGMGSKPQV